MTTSNTYNILGIKEIIQDEADKSIFSFSSSKYELNEKFRSKETSTIIRVFNEMKEKASKTSQTGLYEESQKSKQIKMANRLIKNFDLFDYS